jgi:hypothetical protein
MFGDREILKTPEDSLLALLEFLADSRSHSKASFAFRNYDVSTTPLFLKTGRLSSHFSKIDQNAHSITLGSGLVYGFPRTGIGR